jgi:cysteine synthase A
MIAPVIDLLQARASEIIERAINSAEEPVVMFALEWCEFSWSVRRFLDDIGVQFRVVELDSVTMQANGLGGDIRTALRVRTGQGTIPQIFIGGSHVGGAMDLLKLHDQGELIPLLRQAEIKPMGDARLSGLSYLPKWLAARPA